MSTYLELAKQGPFPNTIDPWAENGRYFRQIQMGMLSNFLAQLQDELLASGCLAALDWTLQTGEHDNAHVDIVPKLNMGVDVDVPDLKALYIHEIPGHRIVTIIEIISPYTKLDEASMRGYTESRDQWIHEKGVQCVEIDLTRSVKRLINPPVIGQPSYHVAIYLPNNSPRFIKMDYGEPLKRIAIPLNNVAIAADLQTAYDYAYQQIAIALHLLDHGFYTEANLPFPTLLTDAQIHEALDVVARWRDELGRLKPSQH